MRKLIAAIALALTLMGSVSVSSVDARPRRWVYPYPTYYSPGYTRYNTYSYPYSYYYPGYTSYYSYPYYYSYPRYYWGR